MLYLSGMKDLVTPIIGRKYHVAWARSNAYVWRLIDINNGICTLTNKYGRKNVTCKVSELIDINKNKK